MVSRLFWQKGPDLAAAAVERLLARHRSDDRPSGRFQFVVLGQGDEEHERSLAELAARHPGQVAVRIAFDLPLGQLIAMRYGAVRLVRRTGGLADSVQAYERDRGRGTGFLFDDATAQGVAAALEEALAVYQDGAAWRRLQLRGMAQDHSWERVAREYADLYRRAVRVLAEALRPVRERR